MCTMILKTIDYCRTNGSEVNCNMLDLDIEEICSDIVSDKSKMTPRLRAESERVMVTLEGIIRFGSKTLASCLGSPMSKNSVLD